MAADQRGGIAIWFAVALLPITMLVGAATDLRRVEEMRSRVQDA
jgi:Flp pilus assembly protein TadG